MASIASVCKNVLNRFSGERVPTKSAGVETNVEASTTLRELIDAQDRVTRLHQQENQLEEESRVLANSLALIDVQANSAKLALVSDTNGTGISATLDRLDADRLELIRKRDGIALAIANVGAQLVPAQVRCAELARAADEERQKVRVAEVKDRLTAFSDSLSFHFRESCRAAYNLMREVGVAVDGNTLNLDSAHRHELLVVLEKINAQLVQESCAYANESWPTVGAYRFVHNLQVVPGLAPPVSKG